jgi:hypothetical protein
LVKKYFLKNGILLFVVVNLLLLSTVTVNAVTLIDDIDDVYDVKNEIFVSRPDIDIITVKCELNGDIANLSMTVKGNIVDSEFIKYSIWTNSDLISGYGAQYFNGMGFIFKDMNKIGSEFSILKGNTISFTFTISDTTKIIEVVGSAMEFSEENNNTWIDNVPNELFWGGGDEDDEQSDDDEIPPNGDDTVTKGNGDGEGGTPGFELLVFILAVAIALIIIRKKKL